MIRLTRLFLRYELPTDNGVVETIITCKTQLNDVQGIRFNFGEGYDMVLLTKEEYDYLLLKALPNIITE